MPEADSFFSTIVNSLAQTWAATDKRPPPAPEAAPGRAAVQPALTLQGVTMLVVEDSRFACEALRLMAQRSGARMRRAATLAEARRHLSVYRPDVVLIDMGLPDGSGATLIRDLTMANSCGVVLGISGDPDQRAVALAAGACGFLDKPIPGLLAFQAALQRHLPGVAAPAPAFGICISETEPVPDVLALSEDLAHAATLLLNDPDPDQRRYLAGFLGGVARSARDAPLEAAARSLHVADDKMIEAVSGMVARRLGLAPDAFAPTMGAAGPRRPGQITAPLVTIDRHSTLARRSGLPVDLG